MLLDRLRYYLLCIIVTAAGYSMVCADDDVFNPDNPPEPMVHSRVYVTADPAAGASALSGAGFIRQGRTIQISVTPNTAYYLKHWTLNGRVHSTSQSFNYKVGDSTANFVAVLKLKPVITLKVEPSGAGSVYGGGTYGVGTRQRIYTNAYSGYTFQYWTLNGVQYTTSRSFYYYVGDSSVVFTAVYKSNTAPPEPEDPDPDEPFNPDSPPEPMLHHHLTVSTNLPATVKPSSITSNGYYPIGRQLSITTTVPTGYSFRYWTLNGAQYSTARTFSYTMGDSTANFVAYFTKLHTITLSVTPSGAGSVSGGGSFGEGTVRTISVTLASGYVFDYWTRNGAKYNAAASFNYTVADEDLTLVAVCHTINVMDTTTFNPDNPPEPEAQKTALQVTATVNNSAVAEVTGVPTTPLFAGDKITLTATATDDCYQFVRWSDNASANPRQITLTGSATYIAVFEQKKITVSTSSVNMDNNDEEGGTTEVYY